VHTPSTIAISDAESHVMDVLWRGRPGMPAEDVIAALVSEQSWQEATIKTLLNRLLKKGAISASKDGRRYLYTAVLKREQWVSKESSSMLERLFGGRVAPLVAHFGKHRKLSAADIAELKKLVEELGDGN
jgi:BlaI family penicillinase repressor